MESNRVIRRVIFQLHTFDNKHACLWIPLQFITGPIRITRTRNVPQFIVMITSTRTIVSQVAGRKQTLVAHSYQFLYYHNQHITANKQSVISSTQEIYRNKMYYLFVHKDEREKIFKFSLEKTLFLPRSIKQH